MIQQVEFWVYIRRVLKRYLHLHAHCSAILIYTHTMEYYSAIAMAPHSSTLAWHIPWMEEPGRLQSVGSLRVGHDWATSLSLFTFMHWRRKCNPLQWSCLENPRDDGTWWAAVCGVTQSWTRLKWLSSSSMYKRRKSCQFVVVWNKSEKSLLYDITYMWNLKKQNS